MAGKKLTFEESVQRLDAIVKALETGDAPLEQSLKLFEEGAALVRGCEKMLDTAEQKVVKLQKGPEGEPVEVPFIEEE